MSANPVFLIAEMACSHDGNVANARAIIDAAGRAGADAIQFQIWRPEDIVVPGFKAMPALKALELGAEDWRGLAAYVREQHPRLEIIACVYDEHALALAEDLGADAFKIHSADLSNPGLVRRVARTGRRVDLSVGGSTLGEIQTALQWIKETSASAVWLMYGYQNFPTRIDDIHLAYMMKLKALFDLPIGYQDHTDAEHPGAFYLPAAAVGLGVDILEKHMTHDRSKQGADHQAALNPDEFVRFAEMTREIARAMGEAVPKPFSGDEERYRVYAKKSIVATRAIAAGERIAEADLAFLRADEPGLPPDAIGRVVGRAARRAIVAHTPLAEADLA